MTDEVFKLKGIFFSNLDCFHLTRCAIEENIFSSKIDLVCTFLDFF